MSIRRQAGVLAIVKAEDCAGCVILEMRGILPEIESECKLGAGGRVEPLKLKNRGPVLPKVFDLDRTFPRFMYMLESTYDEAIDSGEDYQSIVNKVRYFNGQYNPKTGLVHRVTNHEINLKNIQEFCDKSMAELVGVAPEKVELIKSKYPRKVY